LFTASFVTGRNLPIHHRTSIQEMCNKKLITSIRSLWKITWEKFNSLFPYPCCPVFSVFGLLCILMEIARQCLFKHCKFLFRAMLYQFITYWSLNISKIGIYMYEFLLGLCIIS
jgi:hypothetical protein